MLYQVVEKNGNAVIIENSAGQVKLRNTGHIKFVDPGAETHATGTELPAPSEDTDTPKKGASLEQDPMDTIQPNCTFCSSRKARESSSQKKGEL